MSGQYTRRRGVWEHSIGCSWEMRERGKECSCGLVEAWEAEQARIRSVWLDGPDSEAKRAMQKPPAPEWATDFADVDEGDGVYWAFMRTEDDGTGKQAPCWFTVEVGHERETDEPFIRDLDPIDGLNGTDAFARFIGWGPRITEPDHLVAPSERCPKCLVARTCGCGCG